MFVVLIGLSILTALYAFRGLRRSLVHLLRRNRRGQRR
jgi:hypothetical protein